MHTHTHTSYNFLCHLLPMVIDNFFFTAITSYGLIISMWHLPNCQYSTCIVKIVHINVIINVGTKWTRKPLFRSFHHCYYATNVHLYGFKKMQMKRRRKIQRGGDRQIKLFECALEHIHCQLYWTFDTDHYVVKELVSAYDHFSISIFHRFGFVTCNSFFLSFICPFIAPPPPPPISVFFLSVSLTLSVSSHNVIFSQFLSLSPVGWIYNRLNKWPKQVFIQHELETDRAITARWAIVIKNRFRKCLI